MRAWIGALCIAVLPGIAAAQSLSGEYAFQSPNGPVRLVLEQAAGNRVMGMLHGADGSQMQLQGELDSAGRVIGTISVGSGTGWFAAGIVDGRLLMAVAEFDPSTGQPDMENGWSLTFERVGGMGTGMGGGAAAGSMGMGQGAAPGAAMGGQPGAEMGGQPGLAEDTPLIRQWRQHLTGKRLSYRDSYYSNDIRGSGGFSMKWDAFLCSDGTFVFQQGSDITVDVRTAGRSSFSRDGTSGTWRLVEQMGQVYIVYQMADGTSDYGALRFENGATYLDRDRVYVTEENPYCR